VARFDKDGGGVAKTIKALAGTQPTPAPTATLSRRVLFVTGVARPTPATFTPQRPGCVMCGEKAPGADGIARPSHVAFLCPREAGEVPP